jgi:hypothetical protein
VTFRVPAAIVFKAHQAFVLVESTHLRTLALANANGFTDGLILLRHKVDWREPSRTAAGTSWQGCDESVDQPSSHGSDRVGDVTFRPQRQRL